ncbi:MAG: hypothetical protein WC829_20350 [Hyphomicrobium sp.]|jgi:hypothetical protein
MIKNHKADSFDAGRAASISVDPDPASVLELKRIARPGSNVPPGDEDMLALLLAVMSLTDAEE